MAAFHQQNESVLRTANDSKPAERQESTQSVLSHIARLPVQRHTEIYNANPSSLSFLSCDSINVTFFDYSIEISGEKIGSVS